MDIQQLAWRYFSKKNGYVLRPDVITYLKERIQHSSVPVDKVAKLLEYIADNFAAIVGKSVEIVERKTLEEVVEKLFKAKISITAGANIDPRDFCAVISTSLLGKWKYDERSNTFKKTDSIDGPRQHYTLLKKKLSLLMPTLSLQNINGLKGKENGALVTCFGMIQEFKEGTFYLEDLDDAIRLEIPKSCQIDYTVCKNFYVLVTGSIQENGDLLTQYIRSIPAMNIEDHKKLLPTLDYANVMKRLEKRSEIEAVECNSQDFSFCFINDLWLDYAGSKQKITRLFESLKNHRQVAFIFCGHLFSPSFSGDRASILKDLALIINKTCPKSLFIFSHNCQVPLFPQPPLPSSIFKAFGDHSIRYYTAQNPVRVAYCTQEIVALDDSLCRQLYRNTLCRMGCVEDLSYEKCKREIYKLLIDQAFLGPMESQAFDPDTFSSMCLYPSPNVLFVNQTGGNDFFIYAGTVCIAQKSFSIVESNSVFLYSPSARQINIHEF